jgi:hypothetical protein
MRCPNCGGTTIRRHRRGFEKLIFSQTYRCRRCNIRFAKGYFNLGIFEKFASCPQCGNPAPDQRSRRDKVDSMLGGVVRLVHWALGGKLYHCVFCRLQFYDVRPLKPFPQNPEAKSDANKATMAS